MIASTRVLMTVAFTLSCVAPAFARSDFEAFNKLIGTVAPDVNGLINAKFKPKLACVCVASSLPGFIVSTGPPGGFTTVLCVSPHFSGDGEFESGIYCAGAFVTLPR